LRKILLITGSLLISILLINGCKPTRHIPEGKYFLTKNTIHFEHKYLESGDVSNFIKQKPNKKQWGLWLRVRIYKMFDKGKDNKSKKWMRNTLGSEPVYLDTALTDQTVRQLRLYMNSKGFFNSDVKREIWYNKKHKFARVTYNIRETRPYYLRNVTYTITDPTMDAFVASDLSKGLLKKGDRYDADNLSKERERIASDLNNCGYYYFSPDFIRFTIDSALNSRQLDINVEISDPVKNAVGGSDSLISLAHRRYYINNLYIHTDYQTRNVDTIPADTMKVKVHSRHKGRPDKVYYFIYHGKLRIKPKTITQQIFIDSGDFFRYDDLEKSHKQLLDLKIYRFANILMDDISDTIGPGRLNMNVYLSRLPVQALSLETQITNKDGNLGTSLGVVYENRNLFHGAEILQFKVNGAVEIDKLSFSKSKQDRVLEKLPFFNTIEAGTELTLKIPKFLIPVHQEKFSKNFRPKTNISLGFNYYQRPSYTRYLAKGSFGYEWKESAAKTHLLNPLEINTVIIYPDSSFKAIIDAFPDKITQNSYRDHIISSIKYSYIYNTQQLGQNKDFMYFRGNIELAGFFFWTINAIRGAQGSYLLFKIPYSQFARFDADYRYYKYFTETTSLATRVYFGMGMPLSSDNSLPFEKYFYLGGSNSMRGWRIRTLGPGSYNEPDSVKTDNLGEIGLELNAELRFPIYKYFRGAIFADAGNVWMRKKNPAYPNGEFRFDTFYSDIALDAGFGLRIDFGYFLVRLDLAAPVRDPKYEKGHRWIGKGNYDLKILGNFGIGYPF
jgi:outer membrane protein assembly factor BamA